MNAIDRFAATLLRIVVAMIGLVMFFGVLLVGAVVAIFVIAWALLRGKRITPLHFAWRRSTRWSGRPQQPGQPGQSRPTLGEVVDIDAREISSAPEQAEPGGQPGEVPPGRREIPPPP